MSQKQKIAISQEDLEKLYLTQGLSSRDIASIYNVNKTTVLQLLKQYNIQKSSKVSRILTKEKFFAKHNLSEEVLENLYLIQLLPLIDIAEYCNTSIHNIQRAIKFLNLQRNHSNLQLSLKRRRNTTQEKYGVDYISQLDSVKEKSKQTCMKKYGVEYTSQIPESREKFKDTCTERYGHTSPMANESVKSKSRQTCIERYGVEHTSQTPESREKFKDTCMKKYGVTHTSKLTANREKAKQTCIERYNVENPMQDVVFRDKQMLTIQATYGTPHALQNPELLAKAKQTCMEKYSVENPMQSIKVQQHFKDAMHKKYDVLYPLQSKIIKDKSVNTNLEKYGVPYYCMTEECIQKNKNIISKKNKYWQNLLETVGYKVELEFCIGNRAYDIHIQDTNIIIEINPSVTHNSTLNIYSKIGKIKPKDYHYQKSKLATENGYHCIHVWDWDDKEKILNLFKSKAKIPARKTKVTQIDIKEANTFNNLYHLQGTCKGQQIIYGLYYEDQLVSLMSFGKPRYNKNYEWELLRYTIHPEYMVIGGAEKLFKHFIQEYTPQSLISYCDYSKFSGQVYKKLGFKLKNHTHPACHWVKGAQRITQAQLNKYGFDKLLGKEYGCYGKGTNNQELMLQHGFVEVYDCGQLVLIYNPTNI